MNIKSKYKTGLVLKIGWSLTAIEILILFLATYDTTDNRDADLVLLLGMVALSFPVGGFVIMVLSAVEPSLWDLLARIDDSAYFTNSVVWLICTCLGYIQWFVVMPRMWSAMRAPPPA